MKKTFVMALALGMGLFAATAAYSHCGHCGMGDDKKMAAGEKHECKDGMCKMHGGSCPAMVQGAEVTVTNTADGVTVAIKGKDKDAVKKIQEAGAKMAKGECCGHEHGHKDGKKEKKDKKN